MNNHTWRAAGVLFALVSALALSGCAFLQDQGFIPPDTPSGLAVGDASASSLGVTWSSATGAASYHLYRSTSSTGPWTSSVYDGASTSFTDSGLAAETVYYYMVRAINAAGSSDDSEPASGTTSAPSSDATLSALALADEDSSTYAYTPAFSPTTYAYDAGTVNPASGSTVFILTLTLTDPNAVITSVSNVPDGETASEVTFTGSGGVYMFSLDGYYNDITIVVTAQDGTSTQTYTLAAKNYMNG